ncbi:response regulator transcription factor [Paenibacillus sinopodophylli]|uniref:response regulator transcription factor n=1 Tax=Paenibacillus sinopodophylli TaxID=1837342 RepID=UPI001485FF95
MSSAAHFSREFQKIKRSAVNYLRENESELLVIVLSATRDEEDKITALGLGAVDFVTKPFSPMELIARLQTNLRRLCPKAHLKTPVLQLNNLKLDVDNLLLIHNEESYTLTQMECELIHLFMKNPDRVLTKRQIYQQIWNHENYDDNTLSVLIYRLRKKLEPLPSSSHHIHTIRNVVYRETDYETSHKNVDFRHFQLRNKPGCISHSL